MNENPSATTQLAELREDLQRERRKAASRAKSWIAVRVGVVLLVVVYMTWLGGAVGRISAEELTRFAATSLESKLPELRADLRDYAIAVAPEVTDRARDLLLEVPGQLRTVVERELGTQADRLIARLEADMDLAITTVIDEQLELVRNQDPNASPEEQLDTIILGVSDAFRETLIDGIDELYEHSTRERLCQQGGAFTGELEGGPLTDRSKAEAIVSFSKERALDLSRCYDYADSLDDIPMLEAAGYARVVNPGRRLRKIALAKKWKILIWDLEENKKERSS